MYTSIFALFILSLVVFSSEIEQKSGIAQTRMLLLVDVRLVESSLLKGSSKLGLSTLGLTCVHIMICAFRFHRFS